MRSSKNGRSFIPVMNIGIYCLKVKHISWSPEKGELAPWGAIKMLLLWKT
jgi:hypothetical protein